MFLRIHFLRSFFVFFIFCNRQNSTECKKSINYNQQMKLLNVYFLFTLTKFIIL